MLGELPLKNPRQKAHPLDSSRAHSSIRDSDLVPCTGTDYCNPPDCLWVPPKTNFPTTKVQELCYMRAGRCGKIPIPQAPVKHKLLLSPCAGWKCSRAHWRPYPSKTLLLIHVEGFLQCITENALSCQAIWTLCRRYLFQNESALNLKNS